MTPLENLSEKVRQSYGEAEQALFAQALDRWQQHEGANHAKRVMHAAAVTVLLAEWGAPCHVAMAGLLHDLLTPGSAQDGHLQDLRTVFGNAVAEIAVVLARLRHIWYYELGQATDASENLSRAASELRQAPMAAMIRFADQIVRFAALDDCSIEEQELLATVNKGLLVPLANRLGVQFIRRQLDDQAFQILQADNYRRTLARYPLSERTAAAEPVLEKLCQALAVNGIAQAQVELSPVSVYWLFRHEKEQGSKKVPLHLVQPLLINVAERGACYQALGVIHRLWQPLPDTFIDYIAAPRPNGYRALHTRVKVGQGEMQQCQCLVRTAQMTQVAESGIAAAWQQVPSELLPSLPSWDEPPAGMMAVFTPMGESRILPDGATVIDFAFAVHRALGHSLTGALVNEKRAPLTRTLKDGDVVKLLKSPVMIGPSPEWIHLVKTNHARQEIRNWYRRHEPRRLIEEGKKHLNRLMELDGLTLASPGMWELLHRTAKTLWHKSPDELLKDIGIEALEPSLIYNQMRQLAASRSGVATPSGDSPSRHPLGVYYPYRYARCCNPSPPDPIVGYLTNRDVISIHSGNCPEIRLLPTFPLDWPRISLPYRENIDIVATNRLGIVRDVATCVANAGISPISFHADVASSGSAMIEVGLSEIPGEDIRHMIDELEDIPGVRQVKSQAPHMPTRTPRNSIAFQHFHNPYTKEPVEGDSFFGREEEFNRLLVGLRFLAPGASMSIWGPRRIGKTSLLKEFARRHRTRDDYLVVRIDMALAVPTTLTFLMAIMTAMDRQCANPELRAPNYGRVRKDPLGHFQRFMSRAFDVESKHLILLLDEFELLETMREEGATWLEISRLFKALIQSGNGITFIFAGSGSLSRLLSKVPSLTLLQEVTQNENLGCLTPQAARALIRQAPNIVYQDEVVDELVRLTVGHPWYLQQICDQLYDEATKPNAERWVTQTLLDTTLAHWVPAQELDFVGNLVGNHVGVGQEAQRKNLLMLTAVAECAAKHGDPERWASVEQIARTGLHAIINPEELPTLLKALARIESLQTQHDQLYRLKVPICELWFQKRYSVTSFMRDIML